MPLAPAHHPPPSQKIPSSSPAADVPGVLQVYSSPLPCCISNWPFFLLGFAAGGERTAFLRQPDGGAHSALCPRCPQRICCCPVCPIFTVLLTFFSRSCRRRRTYGPHMSRKRQRVLRAAPPPPQCSRASSACPSFVFFYSFFHKVSQPEAKFPPPRIESTAARGSAGSPTASLSPAPTVCYCLPVPFVF